MRESQKVCAIFFFFFILLVYNCALSDESKDSFWDIDIE